MASEIILKHVTKQYGNGTTAILAIDDVSFQVAPGEFFTILGPSGCGKSTIIALIAGFVPASSGRIMINGTPIRKPGTDRVVVSQEYSLFSWKTALANVEFGLKAGGLSKIKRQEIARQCLDKVHLGEFADRYPVELSGGMRQRLALARALAVEPTCMLLDEPFAALDMQMRQTLQDELLNIWEQTKQTILLVTHDLDEALYLSDRMLVMGPRPSYVRTILQVPFPRPRLAELRLTNIFQKVKREMSIFFKEAL